jgi:ribosomal protein S18 acetylase RimI-like enzyme
MVTLHVSVHAELSLCIGVVEGNLGSIRYFAVLPKFHGLCVGQRLLMKTEREMVKEKCVRCMVSVASTRNKLIDWIISEFYMLVWRRLLC